MSMTVIEKIRAIVNELLAVKEPAEKPRDVFFVSELVGCLRKAYYDRTRPAKQATTNVVGILVGKAIHEKFNVIAASHGCQTEVNIAKEIEGVKVIGSADAVCDDIVIELKVGDVSVDYDVARLQAAIYAVLLGAKEAYVVIIDRQSGVVKLERAPVERDKIRRFLEERVRELKEALRRRRAPTPDRRFCKYCPYKWTCMSSRK